MVLNNTGSLDELQSPDQDTSYQYNQGHSNQQQLQISQLFITDQDSPIADKADYDSSAIINFNATELPNEIHDEKVQHHQQNPGAPRCD